MPTKQVKFYDVVVKERREDGGKITISTSSLDRDLDRIFPLGGGPKNGEGLLTDSYLQNPIVLVSHQYTSPEYIAGRTNKLDVKRDSVSADFTLRPAATPYDLQNVTRLAWEGGWIRMASIGFMPHMDYAEKNSHGGYDYYQAELYEWSLVAIGSNRDSLARANGAMAVKGLQRVAPLAAAIKRLRGVAQPGYMTQDQAAELQSNLDAMTRLLPTMGRYGGDITDKMARILDQAADEIARY